VGYPDIYIMYGFGLGLVLRKLQKESTSINIVITFLDSFFFGQEMKPQADLANIGQQKSFWNPSSEPQLLCQYKFYPTYLTAKAIQMKVEDIKCNEAASRFTVENRTELQQRGLVG